MAILIFLDSLNWNEIKHEILKKKSYDLYEKFRLYMLSFIWSTGKLDNKSFAATKLANTSESSLSGIFKSSHIDANE